jgi:hypothetical protein
MKTILAALACSALVYGSPVAAQTALGVVNPNASTTLQAGTPVRLRLLNYLTSKQAKTGQVIDLETVDDVMVDGHIVIPRGSPARGEITFAKGTGMWGKSGKLETQVTAVHVNGRDIGLRGTVTQKGDTGSAGVIGAIAFLPLAGFFVTGTSAELAAGTSYSAFTVSDVPLAFVAPTPTVATPVAATTLVTAVLAPAATSPVAVVVPVVAKK